MNCNYNIDRIIRYSQGILSKEDAAEVLSHIESCTECSNCYEAIVKNGGSIKFYGKKSTNVSRIAVVPVEKEKPKAKKSKFILFPQLSSLKPTLIPILISVLVCAAAYFLVQNRQSITGLFGGPPKTQASTQNDATPTPEGGNLSPSNEDKQASTLIGELPEYNIKLFSGKTENSMYRDMLLDINGTQRYFDWKCESNPTDAPQLAAVDLDGDEHMEAVIILTTGTGTGIHKEDIHIVDMEDLSEMDVENPVHIIKKNVKMQMNSQEIRVTINGKTWTFGEEYFEAVPENERKEVSFGSILRYGISGNRLFAAVPAQIGTGTFIGEVVIEYIYKDSLLQMKEIDFTPYELK